MVTVSAFCLREHVAQVEATWSYQREKALLRDPPVMAAQLMLLTFGQRTAPCGAGGPCCCWAAGPVLSRGALWARPRSPGAEHVGVCLPRAHFLSLVRKIRTVIYRRAPDHGEAGQKVGNHAAFAATPHRLSCALLPKQTTLNPREWRQQRFSLTLVTPSWRRLCPTQSFSQDLGWRSSLHPEWCGHSPRGKEGDRSRDCFSGFLCCCPAMERSPGPRWTPGGWGACRRGRDCPKQ